MLGQSRRDRGSDARAEALMGPREVVAHEVQGNGVDVILDLLREPLVRQVKLLAEFEVQAVGL